MKTKVLIMTDYYLPSIKGGGPIQSVKNLVDNLSEDVDFYIVTSDRDLGDKEPFENINTEQWIRVSNVNVFYTKVSKITIKKLSSIFNTIEFDILYLNSFFSYKFSILPLIIRKINKIKIKKVILSPRGEFSPGALKLKSFKKKIYIYIMKKLGLYNNIIWHATANIEKNNIIEVFGKQNIVVVQNLTTKYKSQEFTNNLYKYPGKLNLVFISRIHPKKNLYKALEFFKHFDGDINFKIYGPIEKKDYWEKCQKLIDNLPLNIKVSYNGILKHEQIIKTFKENHIFLFPTLGENFGHVIYEAFISGCPVIISDQTPWEKLEAKQIGWDIKLTNESKFIEILNYCVNMDNSNYQKLSKNAFNYGKLLAMNNESDINIYKNLFSE